MIPAVDIRHDLNGIAADLGLMFKERMKAAVTAINKTMVTVRKEAAASSGELARSYPGLKVSAIKARIALRRASQFEPRARLTFSNSRIPLLSYRVRQTKSGIRGTMPEAILRIDAVSGRASPINPADLSHAFIQRSRRFGRASVWLRQSKERMPIDVLVTPSLSEVLVKKRINAALARRARERFRVVFAQEARGVRFRKPRG